MNHPRIGYQQQAAKDNQKATSTMLFDYVELSWSRSRMKDVIEAKEGELPSKKKGARKEWRLDLVDKVVTQSQENGNAGIFNQGFGLMVI